MTLTLAISPHGYPLLERSDDEETSTLALAVKERIEHSFALGVGAGLAHLATTELRTALPPSLGFAREVGQRYLTALCHTPGIDEATEVPSVAHVPEDLAAMMGQAPPMKGSEYLNVGTLGTWWAAIDEFVRQDIRGSGMGAGAYLREKNPLWRLVGRVTFHLAENKRDEQRPFAFLATYTHQLSNAGGVRHLPLSRALHEYSEAKNRNALVSLLTPIHKAAERCPWIAALVERRSMYQPLAWTPKQAYEFLRDVPQMEASGLIVRVPDWWKAKNPPRPRVNVKIGEAAKSTLGVDALLDFSVGVSLDGQNVTEEEMLELLSSTGGLVRLRGQWVEVDPEQLSAALKHWKQVEREARGGGITFFEGMRLLSGADLGSQAADESVVEQTRHWTGITPGDWLGRTLEELRDPARIAQAAPRELRAKLRPYQQTGVNWLRFMTRLGLGACLADDMGLGKTIQTLSLLLHMQDERSSAKAKRIPSLLVVPASLIANWKSEIARFAPSIRPWVAHPSEAGDELQDASGLNDALAECDLAITTYGMLARSDLLRDRQWDLVILDEAQAIKNSGTRQTKAVKQVKAAGRIAMTGTPIENRLSDLWSLFDFLNPGLLGSAKAFSSYVKRLQREEEPSYAPLRTLVKPYILRRLKTDKRIIADLPEKIEVQAYCGLSKQQASLYEQSVRELAAQLGKTDGIQRRGIVLAYLMRLKQICNHPSQWLGDAGYDPKLSGKFQRLAEITEELAARQEKALIFTQFREISQPLSDYLQGIYRRPGLVLHGGTPVARRREMVEAFQRDDGPPFFVLSLKAGGVGLNLTAASQVIHFDRWWNPAVENQATDRAFRIGQKRNVVVHKFVCRGTVEEKIDALIADKVGLSKELLEGGGEQMLTEMNDRELLDFVALDITHSAGDEAERGGS